MTHGVDLETFGRFAREYQPFAWEVSHDTHQEDIRGKHSVLISLIRYWHIVRYLQTAAAEGPMRTLLDIGPYPGSFVKLVKTFLGPDVKYNGIGLGFSGEYVSEMERLGATLFTTELDPRFIEPRPLKPWPFTDVDCCLLLDVIEHLVDPTHCLDRINEALRMGGKLILTTDNITALGYIYGMLRSGESPNVAPPRSHVFYRGDWRPHFREFSRGELVFFLEYSGFRVVKHEYFERLQGDYYLDSGGGLRVRNRYRGVKGAIHKALVRALPHVRDHQILLAEKAVEHEEQVRRRPAPTTDMKEWLRIRQSFGL